jgi:hypothetical protein
MSTKTATPWGQARLVEEVSLPQRTAGKHFSAIVQLLEIEGGERLLRFAYTTGGAVRRGPVTVRVRDLEKLRRSIARRPGLADVLGKLVGEA